MHKEATRVTEAVRVPWAGGWAPICMSLIYCVNPTPVPVPSAWGGRGLRPSERQIPAPPTGGSCQRPQCCGIPLTQCRDLGRLLRSRPFFVHANSAGSYSGVSGTLLWGPRSREIAAGLRFIGGLVSRVLKPTLSLAAWLE